MKSLLWPEGPPGTAPDQGWIDDLELAVLLDALATAGQRRQTCQTLLTTFTCDLAVIRARQAVLADLLDIPLLRERLEAQLDALAALAVAGRAHSWSDDSSLLTAARRLGELELYVDTVEALRGALHGTPIRSDGLKTLRTELDTLAREPAFRRLAKELPALKRPLEQLASVTVGINLDSELRPVAATLLAINEQTFNGRQGLLGRLLGGDATSGLSPLHKIDRQRPHPFATPLFRDLERLLDDVAGELEKGLSRYNRIQASAIALLWEELAFFLGAARLVDRLRAVGLPCSFPELVPAGEQHTRVEDLYDPVLALRMMERTDVPSLVPNDLRFDDEGRVAILTGPNRGGKSTYLRAAGMAHVMAQAGLPVTAQAAVLSPVDAIYTQFTSGESQTVGYGRFDQEARRLASIFDSASSQSLILLNEPLTGTSPGEALQLARGVVEGLQHLGAHTIFVTHLHALAHEATAFTETVPQAPVMSLVASPPEPGRDRGELRRSFKVVPAAPPGESRAMEIAREHGLSPQQIQQRLRARGLLKRPCDQ